MQNILIVCTGAPYGSESLYNALRLAIALKEQEECSVDLRLFLLSDAVTVALNGQAPTEGYNLRLGQRRADSVVNFLQQGGIAAGRMQAKSYGESQPIADNNTEEGRAQNRRVEIHPQNTQQCVPTAP